MSNSLVYKEAYFSEAFGAQGVGVKIEIAMSDRELDDTDSQNLSALGREIMETVQERSIALDPKSQEHAKEERAKLIALFPEPIYVEDTPNGYCNQYCCKHLPWFIVTTKIGKFVIGWRKRVINIDWSSTQVPFTARGVFPNEDVTQGDRSIHAYGYDKAKEYIDHLMTLGANFDEAKRS